MKRKLILALLSLSIIFALPDPRTHEAVVAVLAVSVAAFAAGMADTDTDVVDTDEMDSELD